MRGLLTGLAMACLAPCARGEEQADVPPGEAFVLADVTTELQARLLGTKLDHVQLYLLLNPDGMIRASGFGSESAVWPALERELRTRAARWREQGVKEPLVCSEIRFRQSDSSRNATRALQKSLLQTMSRAGCSVKSFSAEIVSDQAKWDEQTKHLLERADPEGGEPYGGSDGVRVYAVQTALSRHLAHGADCVVDFREPVNKTGGLLRITDVDTAITAAHELELEQRRLVHLCVRGAF